MISEWAYAMDANGGRLAEGQNVPTMFQSLFPLVVIIGIVYLLIRVTKKKNSHLNDTPGGDIKCPNCGFIGAPVKYTRGSFWIEIILWLCFLVPGLIYSVWRLTTKSIVCPRCKYNNIIPFVKPDGTSHDEKICPYCAETIKAAAKICKHCSKEVT